MSIGALFNPPVRVVPDAPRCENNAANCVGRCANPVGGTFVSKCMSACDRRVNKCLVRAHETYDFSRR
jgi:hypothetical protein